MGSSTFCRQVEGRCISSISFKALKKLWIFNPPRPKDAVSEDDELHVEPPAVPTVQQGPQDCTQATDTLGYIVYYYMVANSDPVDPRKKLIQ